MNLSGLIVATGNPLRRDDGVAHAVAACFEGDPRVGLRRVLQITPEIAAEMAGYDSVVFVDADVMVARVTMAFVSESESDLCPALTHASTPPEIVALSRNLFGFAGTALVCRLPVDDLSSGEGLSRRATEAAALAISELGQWRENYLNDGPPERTTPECDAKRAFASRAGVPLLPENTPVHSRQQTAHGFVRA